MEKFFREIRETNEKLAKEPPKYGGPVPIAPPPVPQLSQITIMKPNANVAYVAYNLTLKPNPSNKPPVPLLAVLRKEQSAWKVVFSAMP